MEMNKKLVEVRHPLINWKPGYIKNWEHWLQLFHAAELAEVRHSLLHFGYQVAADPQERAMFYLSIADGHMDDHVVFQAESKEDNSYTRTTVFGEKNLYGLRQVVARKAFEVLCLQVFKIQGDTNDYDNTPWARIFWDEKPLRALLYFFRLEKESTRFVNLWRDDRFSQIAEKFLHDFVRKTWPSKDKRWPDCFGEKSREMFERYRLQYFEILVGLGAISSLINKEVNRAILTKLEELALSDKVLINGEYRKPVSVDEAFHEGSQAAMTLILLRIKLKEEKRLQEIRKLEEQAKENQKRLEKLKA